MTDWKCGQQSPTVLAEAKRCMNDMATTSCNDTEVRPCVAAVACDGANDSQCCTSIQVIDKDLDKRELSWFSDKHTVDVSINSELHPSVESHSKDVMHIMEVPVHSEIQVNELGNSSGLRFQTHVREVPNGAELDTVAENLQYDAEEKHSNNVVSVVVEPREVENVSEIETCAGNNALESMCNGDLELVRSSKDVKNDFGLELCPKGELTEPSNGDVYSEVSNPNQSTKHASSSLTVSGQPLDVLDKDHGCCGEVTSACCRTSFSDRSFHREEHSNGKLESVSTSHVVLEIPKHIRPTGIRKLTFKFQKRKEDFDSDISAVKPLAGDELHKNKIPSQCFTNNGINDSNWNYLKNAEMDLNMSGSELDRRSPSCVPNRELMMSKKIIPDSNPKNVKTLSHATPFNQRRNTEVPAERKRLIKKARHNACHSFWDQKKGAEGGTRKRDNDLHKLLFMPNGLPDGTSLAYYSKGKRILSGYKQGNGIVCSCCSTEISPSQFEAHAGWAVKRQPYRHIYTSNGLTLHDVALMLANSRNLTSSNSDDVCAICGDGGDLKICNGCPRAFHAACVDPLCLPTDDLHCPSCGDEIGPSRRASGESRPIILRLKRVVKAPEFEPGGCIICRSQDFSAVKFDDRTVIICDQCEKEYHVGCLRETGMCDLKELPKDKWFCCDNCNKIFETLQNMACGVPGLIPAEVSAALCKKQTMLALNDATENEVRWCILSGKNCVPEHSLLLSRAAAIFRECFDPIVAKSGRDLIPIMVHGKNISGQDFSGMYCAVLIVKSVVVSAALVRIFGQEVAELPLVATNRENQGKGYFPALFSCIERLLSSMNVKHLVLPAAEEAEPMWTNKLGFRKTSHEQMLKYRYFQITIFKGTSLLEKDVQQP